MQNTPSDIKRMDVGYEKHPSPAIMLLSTAAAISVAVVVSSAAVEVSDRRLAAQFATFAGVTSCFDCTHCRPAMSDSRVVA